MSRQSCLTDRQLPLLLDDSLADADIAPLIAHLESCQDCQQRLDQLSGMDVPSRAEWESTIGDTDSVLNNLISNLKKNPSEVPDPLSGEDQVENWRAVLDPPDSPDSLGKIADYDLTEVLGSGGMGVVVRARDTVLNRDVAIKFPHFPRTGSEKTLQRFLQESRSAAALEHENVVRVYQVGVQHDLPYLVMELVEGETLQDCLNQKHKFSADQIRSIAIQAARGLDAAHQEGLLHGDIKPANLLIDRDTGQLKLSDFGLARALSDSQSATVGVIAGTPEYMSPEQASASPSDARSDLYSLGAVLFALATGNPALISDDGAELDKLLQRIVSEPVASVRKRNPSLDRDLARMIDRLLNKRPDDRPDSALEVATSLSNDGSRLRRSLFAATLATITLLACLVAAETAGWIDLVAGVGPITVTPQSHPFMIVSRELALTSLEEAIELADDGDVILIRSPGPHAVRPIQIRDKNLTLRGDGEKPAIVPFQESTTEAAPLITTNGSLILESLEIQFQSPGIIDAGDKWSHCAVRAKGGLFRISKCRFRIGKGNAAIGAETDNCQIDDCEIYGHQSTAVLWRPGENSELSIRDSVLASRNGLLIDVEGALGVAQADVEFTGSTFRTRNVVYLMLDPKPFSANRSPPRWRFSAVGNVFDTDRFFCISPFTRFSKDGRLQRARRLLDRLFQRTGKNNRLRQDASLAGQGTLSPVPLFPANQFPSPWTQYWQGGDTAFAAGKMSFHGPAESQQRVDHRLENFEPAIGDAD